MECFNCKSEAEYNPLTDILYCPECSKKWVLKMDDHAGNLLSIEWVEVV